MPLIGTRSPLRFCAGKQNKIISSYTRAPDLPGETKKTAMLIVNFQLFTRHARHLSQIGESESAGQNRHGGSGESPLQV